VIPYNPMLSSPTLKQIYEETKFEVLCGKDHLERYVSSVIVGAMQPHAAAKYLTDDSLLITPGDRQDNILMALSLFRDRDAKKLKVAGIVLSGGIVPDKITMDLLQRAGLPVLLSKADTYTVAMAIHDLTVKIRPRDTEKINLVVKMIKENIDLAKILKGI